MAENPYMVTREVFAEDLYLGDLSDALYALGRDYANKSGRSYAQVIGDIHMLAQRMIG